MIGMILGNRYEILREIGSGGMANVYLAHCRLLNRNVAVKILKSEFVNDKEFLERFNKEAQVAATISSPNIVNVYDVGHDGDIHYIVMEYVEGQTLKEYIRCCGANPGSASPRRTGCPLPASTCPAATTTGQG